MAPSFDNDPDTWQRPDWELLQNGFVTLFWRHNLYDAAKAQLAALGYLVVELDAGNWHSAEDALGSIGTALHFPDYYGKNGNALVDCLRDVATFEYGSDPASAGTLVALHHYDAFASHDPQLAWTLLDILADTGRQALLVGHRFVVIVQSDDPDASFPAVGAVRVLWNHRETTRSRRT